MTSGVVVVLGPVGRNFAAGMTGGRAYVLDSDLFATRLNLELVEAAALSTLEAEEAHDLVARHLRHTGSDVARRLLEDWRAAVAQLRLVTPRADAARVESEHEGTATVEANAEVAAETR